jgi:2'-5' RNA ligase
MRLFVALEIPGEIRDALALVLKELRGFAPLAKWVRAENLHVTLKFLGETESDKVSAIANALGSIRSEQPITLEFRGLGFFPNEKRPRVFWVGMESSPNLKILAEEIDQRLSRLGFPREDRPFTPHLTLARLNPPGLPPKLGYAVAENSSRNFGFFTTREFHLIESKLKSTGAEYTTVQSFSFATET